jgi:hypothetical protein
MLRDGYHYVVNNKAILTFQVLGSKVPGLEDSELNCPVSGSRRALRYAAVFNLSSIRHSMPSVNQPLNL